MGTSGKALTTHLHLVPRSRMSRSCTSSPPYRLHGVYRTVLLYTKFTLAPKMGWWNMQHAWA